MTLLRVDNFSLRYPGAGAYALEGVSFAVHRGEVLGIMGPAGAGKTTLCLALAGFVPRVLGGHATGEIRWGESPADSARTVPVRYVEMVFDDFAAQLTQLNVEREIAAPLARRGYPPDQVHERVREMAARVGLGEQTLARHVWELSGGEQQRLTFAAALAGSPSLLIADEVMGKLDCAGRKTFVDLLRELTPACTVIIVERDAEVMLELADRVLVLAGGKREALGPAHELLDDEALMRRADAEPSLSFRLARTLSLPRSMLRIEDVYGALRDRQLSSDGARESATPPDGATAIELSRVALEYGDGTQALCDVSLRVRLGEVHVLLGASGAGKTTVCACVSGTKRPDVGTVRVCGEDVANRRVIDLAAQVGTVLQNPDEQLSEATIEEEIGFPLRERRRRRRGSVPTDEQIRARVAELAERVGLERAYLPQDPLLAPRSVRRLVTIAQALALEPKVLVLDEPTVGLGHSSRQKVRALLAALREAGVAVLLVENDADFAAEVADTVSVLEQGRVIVQGTVDEVFAREQRERLTRAGVCVPHVAELADRLGVRAVRFAQLVRHYGADAP